MDTKLKNSRKKRIAIAVVGIILLTIATTAFYPMIYEEATKRIAEQSKAEEQMGGSVNEVDESIIEKLYRGCYVLYLEEQQKKSDVTAAEIYLNKSGIIDVAYANAMGEIMDAWRSEFEETCWELDYCVYRSDTDYEKNTDKLLEDVAGGDGEEQDDLLDYYSDFFIVRFDENGTLEIDSVYTSNITPSTLIKNFQHVDRKELLKVNMTDYGIPADYTANRPKNFTVIYGIPLDNGLELAAVFDDGYSSYDAYIMWQRACEGAGGFMLYFAGLTAVAVLVWITRSTHIWKDGVSVERPGNWYMMEAAVVGVCVTFSLASNFLTSVSWYTYYEEGVKVFHQNVAMDAVAELAGILFFVAAMYVIWYLSLYFLYPVFSLGLREYIRQYSFIYQIFPWLKSKWELLKDEVRHIDFSQKSTKTIVKVVALNFALLAVCSIMWFYGIGALLVYSVVLFFLIKKYYDKAGKDYQALLRSVNRMAEGDLDTEITEDLGIFEPFKAELAKVRIGFKKAVDEEVKGQRMKADLITNVSHDLKTPLTAITTYVELLKKEDITEEERRSYIDTLDKKAGRLKVLIEDLFEVSKATSNNIVLHPMEVDVCNLLKQVSIEHVEKFGELGLELRWNLPEEKVILMLDNQKTFRIFENLFSNIQKYAMPGSRVYVSVKKSVAETGETVEVILKNMSANELDFDTEEITERFVRGDVSRNTEGSGLGLAIARSFIEAQGGKFRIEVDGDLFKAVIVFKTV